MDADSAVLVAFFMQPNCCLIAVLMKIDDLDLSLQPAARRMPE